MKSNLPSLLLAASTALLISCSGNADRAGNTGNTQQAPVTNTAAFPAPNTNAAQSGTTGPVQNTPSNSSSATTQSTTSVQLNNSGSNTAQAGPLNPAHGQPGHRCDIAVGAPLNTPLQKPQVNSASAVNAAPALNPTPITVNKPPVNLQAPAQQKTGVRLNPPHGQPGHNCAVQVGQPL